MAIGIFKNANKANVGNVWTTIYTAPAGQTSCFIELDISSIGTTGIQASVRVVDVSAGVTTHLVKQAEIPLGSALQAIDGQKIVLEENDYIQVQCDTSGEAVDVTSALLENVN